jgi:hypothetical protein
VTHPLHDLARVGVASGGKLTGGSCICVRLASKARRQLGGITLRQEPGPR